MTFWAQVLGSALGFIPGAVLIYIIAYRQGRQGQTTDNERSGE